MPSRPSRLCLPTHQQPHRTFRPTPLSSHIPSLVWYFGFDCNKKKTALSDQLVPRPTRSIPAPQYIAMSLDWTHQFCLACDRQTDGATYCSESCRLADFESTSSTPSSGPSSPALNGPSYAWSFSKPASTSNKFYLSPAYDFSSPQPNRSARHAISSHVDTARVPSQGLSPSNSHSSLCSMRSSSSVGLDPAQLSERAARELRAYAQSFESVRLQRRRSH